MATGTCHRHIARQPAELTCRSLTDTGRHWLRGTDACACRRTFVHDVGQSDSWSCAAASAPLECGGKRSATPLWMAERRCSAAHRVAAVQPKRRRRCALPAHPKPHACLCVSHADRPNHVHLIAVPATKQSLRLGIGEAHHRRGRRVRAMRGSGVRALLFASREIPGRLPRSTDPASRHDGARCAIRERALERTRDLGRDTALYRWERNAAQSARQAATCPPRGIRGPRTVLDEPPLSRTYGRVRYSRNPTPKPRYQGRCIDPSEQYQKIACWRSAKWPPQTRRKVPVSGPIGSVRAGPSR